MFTDLFSSVASTLSASPYTPLAAYGLMTFLAAETWGRARAARRVAREADKIIAFLAREERRRLEAGHPYAASRYMSGGVGRDIVRLHATIFLAETLRPLRHRLSGAEVLGPLAGLGFTMLSWALVLPDAVGVLRDNPDHIMRTLGMGAFSSFIGVVIAAAAMTAGKRLDIAEARLQPRIDDLVADDPSLEPPRPSRAPAAAAQATQVA